MRGEEDENGMREGAREEGGRQMVEGGEGGGKESWKRLTGYQTRKEIIAKCRELEGRQVDSSYSAEDKMWDEVSHTLLLPSFMIPRLPLPALLLTSLPSLSTRP